MRQRMENHFAYKGKILHVPSTFQWAIARLKARKKLDFMVMVVDFQIANQEQKTFLKEKKEIPLMPLYEFLHGWEYSIQVSKRKVSNLKTHEKPSLAIILAEFWLWQIKMKHDEKVMSVIRPYQASTYSFTSTQIRRGVA